MLGKAADTARDHFLTTLQETFGRDISVTLRPDEVPIWQEAVDVYYTSPSLAARLLAFFTSIIALVTGMRTSGVVICTNRRVVLVTRRFFLWVLQTGATYETIFCDQLSGVDVGSESTLVFLFKKKVMHLYAAGRPTVSLAFRRIGERELFDRMAKLTDAKFGGGS